MTVNLCQPMSNIWAESEVDAHQKMVKKLKGNDGTIMFNYEPTADSINWQLCIYDQI